MNKYVHRHGLVVVNRKRKMARSVFRFLVEESVGFGRGFLCTPGTTKRHRTDPEPNTSRSVYPSVSRRSQPNGQHAKGLGVNIYMSVSCSTYYYGGPY